MTTSGEDEFGELVDFIPESMHAVGKAANGTQWLVAKSAEDDAAGLMSADQVRELVAKAGDGQGETLSVEVKVDQAAIMRTIHSAAAAYVAKADLSSAELNDLPDSAFAYIEPGGEKDDEGKTTPRRLRHFAIHDKAHADNAASRIAQGAKFGDKAKAKVEAAQRKFGEKVAKADAADPGSPDWESQDAASAESVVAQILGCIPAVRRLAMREATEVGAGHTEDICDVITLQCAIDQLTEAAKNVGAFAVSEHAEAGETGPVTKAQPSAAPSAATAAPSPKENTVEQTTTEVAKAEETAAAGTETATVSKAAALAQQLGISVEQLAELGAQHVLKAATDAAATQTPGAEAAPTDARTIPGTDTVQSPAPAKDEVSKAEANSLVTALSEVMAPVAKQLTELAAQVGTQGERVEKMAAQADNRRSPFLNGASGEAGPALREAMAKSPEWQTVAKALDALPDGAAKDEAKRAIALQALEARFS